MKKILILINNECYFYQEKIIEQIFSNTDVLVNFYLCNDNNVSYKENFFYRFIDDKFPIYRISPLAKINTSKFQKKFTFLNDFKEQKEYFDFIVNLSDNFDFDFSKLSFGEILKPKIDFESWECGAINGDEKTTICLLSSKNNNDWVIRNETSFFTEKGIYNNRDKALFQFQYIFKNFVFLEKNNLNKIIRNQNNKLKYYFSLVFSIFKRKFNSSELNWKLAILNRDNTILTLKNYKGEYWADPFIVFNDNNRFVFFEEIEKQTRKGIISVLKLNHENEILEKKEAINLPFHMSFPNVFKHNGDFYMLPEQIESNQLVLYKAKNFPYDWEKNQVIFQNTKAVDPSIVFHDNMYYLFTNIVEDYEYDNNERMSIFYTEDLLSNEWKAHSKNPVKIDKCSTRNGGKIYTENDDIIRIVQNCNPSYGFSTKKMKITKLSPTEFEEIEIKTIKLAGFQGNHTLNKEEDLTLIDILVKE